MTHPLIRLFTRVNMLRVNTFVSNLHKWWWGGEEYVHFAVKNGEVKCIFINKGKEILTNDY